MPDLLILMCGIVATNNHSDGIPGRQQANYGDGEKYRHNIGPLQDNRIRLDYKVAFTLKTDEAKGLL